MKIYETYPDCGACFKLKIIHYIDNDYNMAEFTCWAESIEELLEFIKEKINEFAINYISIEDDSK